MASKSQVNVLIYDYLVRNYESAKDLLPALKKVLSLPNKSGSIGKLEDIVSEHNAKENVRKKRKYGEEIMEHQMKSSKKDNISGIFEPQDERPLEADIIAKDSDDTDVVKSSMHLTVDRSNNDRSLKDRSSCHSLNILTLENSSSKESHENSGDLFANDTYLSSDVDDIILDIKSINNVNDVAHAIQMQLPLKINTIPLDRYLSPVEKSEMMQPIAKDKIIINTETADENGKSETISETNASSVVKSSSLIEHEFINSNLSSDGETQVKTSAELNKFAELQVKDVRNDSADKVNDKAGKSSVSLNDVLTLNAATTGSIVNELATAQGISIVSWVTGNPSGDGARKSSQTERTGNLLQGCEDSSASDSSDEEYNEGEASKMVINKRHSKDKHIDSIESIDKVSETSVSMKETSIRVQCALNKNTVQGNELMETLESHNSDDSSDDEFTSKLIINEDIRKKKSISKVGMNSERSNSIGRDISQSSTDDTVTSAKDAFSVGTTPFGVESTLASNSISDQISHDKQRSNDEYRVTISKSDQVSGTHNNSVKATRNNEVFNSSNTNKFIEVRETSLEAVNRDDENVNSTSTTNNKTQQIKKSGLISSDSDSSSSDDESVTKSVAFNTSITKHSLKELEIPNIDNHSDKESFRSTPRIIKIQEFSDSDSVVPKPDYGNKIPVLDTLSASKNANETATCSNKSVGDIEACNASKAIKSAKEKEIFSKVNKDIGNTKKNIKMQQSNSAVCHERDSSDDEIPASKTILGSKSDFKCSIESNSEVTFLPKTKTSDSSVKMKSVKTVTTNVGYAKSKKVSSDDDSSMPSTDDEDEIKSNQRGRKKIISGNKSKRYLYNKNTGVPVKQPSKIKALTSKSANKGLEKIKPDTKRQTPQKPKPVCHDSDSSSDDEKDVAKALKSGSRIYTETTKEANKSAGKSNASEVRPNKLKKIAAHAKGCENVKSRPKTQLHKRQAHDDSDSSMPSSSDENENIASKVKKSASTSKRNSKNGNGMKSAIKCDTLGVPINKESTKMKNSAKPVSKVVKVQQPVKPSYDNDSSMPSSDDEETKPDVSGKISKSSKPQTKSMVTKVGEKGSIKAKKISQNSSKKHVEKVESNSKQALKQTSYDSDSSMPSSSDEDIKPAATFKPIKKKKVSTKVGAQPTNNKKPISFFHYTNVKEAVADNATSRSSAAVKGALKTTAKCELSHVNGAKQSEKKTSTKTVSKDTDSDSSLPSSSDDSAEFQIKSDNDESVSKTACIISKPSNENVSIKSSNENKITLSKEDDIIKIPRRRVRIRSKDKEDCRSLKHDYPAVVPKSKEFISSDSSDDDKNTSVPVIPLSQANDGGMKNNALSKLSCQVVLTKLSASSLKSPPKILMTRENDLSSLKSSEEEDDVRILSAAVARSAQKAKTIKARSNQKANIKPMQLFSTTVVTDSDSSEDSSDSETEKKVLPRLTPDKNDLHNSDNATKDRKFGRDLADSSVSEQTPRKVSIHGVNVENFGASVRIPVNNKEFGRTSSEPLKTVEQTLTRSDHMFTPSPKDKLANINKKSVFNAKESPNQEKDATTIYESEQEENSDDICCTIVRALDLLHSDDEAGKISQTQQNHNIESQVSKTSIITHKLSKNVKYNQQTDVKAKASAAPSSMPVDYEKSDFNSSSVKHGRTKKQVQMSEKLDSTNDSSVNNSADLRPAIDSIKVTSNQVDSSKHLEEVKYPNEKSNNKKTSLESLKLIDGELAEHHASKKKKKDKKRKHRERESSLIKANCTPNNDESSILDEPILKKTKFSETPAENSQQTQDCAYKYKSQEKISNLQTGIGDSDDINQNLCISPVSSRVKLKKARKESKKLDNTKSSKQISKTEYLESYDVDKDIKRYIVEETTPKHATEQSTLLIKSVLPMKNQDISPKKSKKRKRSSSLDVRDDKAKFSENENQEFLKVLDDGSKKKKNGDLSFNSEDSQEEEAPVQITLKKMNIQESISKVLSPRRGQISSTPINKATRLKTPDVSIIKPLSIKVRDSKAGESSHRNTWNAKQVTKLPQSKKRQSSSESSSDSEMEVSRSLFN